MKQNPPQYLSWYPENTRPRAKTASGKHRYHNCGHKNVRISADCLPRHCSTRKNNLARGASEGAPRECTVNHNYEYDGSLTCVITRWQRAMKMIDFLFALCNEQGLNTTVGWGYSPPRRVCVCVCTGEGISHAQMQMYTQTAHISTSNI